MNIMHITRRPRTLLRISLLAIFGLVILLGQSQSASAQWATNGNNINNTNTGNVGIGITTPELPLDIRRNAFVFNSDARALIGTYDQTPMAQGVGGGIQFGGKFDTGGSTAGFASISGIKENANNNDFSSALVFTTRTSPNPQTERMRISSSGNVGIGTTTPLGLLDVQLNSATANKLVGRFGNNSTSGGAALRVYANVATNGTLYPALELSDNSFWIGSLAADRTTGLRFRTGSNISSGEANLTDRMVISPAGNVGIGTATPLALASGTLTGRFAHISSSDVTGLVLTGTFPEVLLYDSNGTANNRIFQMMQDGGFAKIRVLNDSISGLTLDNVQVWNLSTGNVGIGTSAPSEKLHVQGNSLVTGNLTVNGNLAAKYQDVAEWVPAAKALPPGTVVTLNRTQSNFVEASTKAYDTRVAGVISSQPGITLGESGENKVLVATTGRVRIKVDATQAPIEIGDLLVTSEKEGVAMKSVPVSVGAVEIHRPGTLIGKALEPLAKGQGEILVLLSLQ